MCQHSLTIGVEFGTEVEGSRLPCHLPRLGCAASQFLQGSLGPPKRWATLLQGCSHCPCRAYSLIGRLTCNLKESYNYGSLCKGLVGQQMLSPFKCVGRGFCFVHCICLRGVPGTQQVFKKQSLNEQMTMTSTLGFERQMEFCEEICLELGSDQDERESVRPERRRRICSEQGSMKMALG